MAEPMEGVDEPEWKKLRLSLERPYKDDNGEPIPVLLDITPDGQQIFEPPEDPVAKVGENLLRIFSERGIDFFERYHDGAEIPKEEVHEEKSKDEEDDVQPMTPEELFRMRHEVIPQLHTAHGEMTQARDMLSMLLGESSVPQIPGISLPPSQPAQPALLSTSLTTKPPPIQSVQAFNTQLVIGGKDLALRKAADLLKSAATSVEKSRNLSEQYWLDALKIRRGNWGLIPAPLPFGASGGRGADKTTKDFLVSFSLEESPVMFRRRAIGRVPTFDQKVGRLEYPLRQYARLQVSIITDLPDGGKRRRTNRPRIFNEEILEESLRAAQAEVVQQEVFSSLIKEASNLPTALARVSERLIVIDAAQATELRFELIDSELVNADEDETYDPVCDLIFSALHVLLLRAHTFVKHHRLGSSSGPSQMIPRPVVIPPAVLQPIVDLLQYQVFSRRLYAEISKVVDGLSAARVPVKLRMNTVGESGAEIVSMLTSAESRQGIGGETLLRIDNRHTLRFTSLSPSTLTVHLPQTTLTVTAITQLTQLLFDEVSKCLLERMREIGTEMSESVHGIWFVDLLTGRTVGRWEGWVLNFQVSFTETSAIICSATRLEGVDKRPGFLLETYIAEKMGGEALLDWARRIIETALVRQ